MSSYASVGANLIGCRVSQNPTPKAWSLFDFALLMAFSKVKQNRTGPLPPPLGFCDPFHPHPQ